MRDKSSLAELLQWVIQGKEGDSVARQFHDTFMEFEEFEEMNINAINRVADVLWDIIDLDVQGVFTRGAITEIEDYLERVGFYQSFRGR